MGRSQINAAFKAMKEIGISEKKTKRALTKLLNLFDKEWDLIVEDNYRLLADTIFEDEDAEAAEEEQQKKSGNTDQAKVSEEDAQMQDEPERPQKRLRLKHQKTDAPSHSQQSPISAPFALKTPKTEPGEPEAFQPHVGNKGKQLVSLPGFSPRTRSGPERASQTLQKGQKASATSKETLCNFALMKPNDEPFTDDMLSLAPLAVIHPDEIHQEVPAISGNRVSSPAEFMHQKSSSETSNQVSSLDAQGSKASKSLVGIESGASKSVDAVDRNLGTLTSSSVDADHIQEAEVSKRILAIDITPSGLGEVKLSLSYNPGLEGKDISFPDLPEVLKKFDDTCLKKYEIADLKFSVMKIFKEFCDHVGELGTYTDGASQDRCNQQDAKAIDSKENCSKDCLNLEISDYVAATADPETISDTSSKFALEYEQYEKDAAVGHSAERDSSAVNLNENSLVLVLPQQLNPTVNCLHDPGVIARGVEGVTITLDQTNCDSLPFFHYISQNVISHNASVSFSFSQIGNEDSCSSCSGDCLDFSSSCCCAHRNGESSYTSDGLLRKDFLDMCIGMVRNPQKDCFVYCKECPLERLKNEDIPDPCKGHLKRKFIKECWLKCDCSKNCGNRVIQHGISRNLQVFWTPEGKGWGLRTLEDLPVGAFVCEYVGEILTCKELHDRYLKRSNHKHSYAVLLDTDWGTKALKGTEFLCLDSTFYGNVARFINHRCLDANLIEIPVEVETPSHHYYHVALFTTRDINALEELTWDYGLDFDDGESYCKTFRCLCGSNFCRHMNRSSRSRSLITLQ